MFSRSVARPLGVPRRSCGSGRHGRDLRAFAVKPSRFWLGSCHFIFGVSSGSSDLGMGTFAPLTAPRCTDRVSLAALPRLFGPRSRRANQTHPPGAAKGLPQGRAPTSRAPNSLLPSHDLRIGWVSAGSAGLPECVRVAGSAPTLQASTARRRLVRVGQLWRSCSWSSPAAMSRKHFWSRACISRRRSACRARNRALFCQAHGVATSPSPSSPLLRSAPTN